MAVAAGPDIVEDGLVFYFDVNNSLCVDASTSIVGSVQGTSTKLNCLVSDLQLEAYDNTNDNMTFVQENGQYVCDQVGTNGGFPGWRSTSTVARTDDYTFISWFKYNYGSEYQRAQNIYGGGFISQTSFYLSPGGTSASHGALRYSGSPTSSQNAYSVTSSLNGGNDGNWHMFATTDSGGDGNQTTKVFIDGVLKQSATSNGSYVTPTGDRLVVWGSWSGTYGCFGGRNNCFMYYNRALSEAEINKIYQSMRPRFNV